MSAQNKVNTFYNNEWKRGEEFHYLDLAKKLNLNDTTVNTALRRMQKQGKLEWAKMGTYRRPKEAKPKVQKIVLTVIDEKDQFLLARDENLNIWKMERLQW